MSKRQSFEKNTEKIKLKFIDAYNSMLGYYKANISSRDVTKFVDK